MIDETVPKSPAGHEIKDQIELDFKQDIDGDEARKRFSMILDYLVSLQKNIEWTKCDDT